MVTTGSWGTLLSGAQLALLVGFGWLAWRAYRHRGRWGALALCLLLGVPLGYASFRATCSRPLTCDVGGPEAAAYYLTHVFPSRALLYVLVLVCAAVVVLRRKRGGGERFTIGDGAVGAGVLLASWVAATLLFDALGLLSF